MLQELDRLSIEADGRYAQDGELEFLDDYLDSTELRIRTFEKIRDQEDKIIHHLYMRVRGVNPQSVILQRGKKDLTGIWTRDMKHILRLSAAAMLVDDLDRLREGFLIWHQTINKAQKVQHITKVSCDILIEIMGQYLTPEETALITPALRLDQAVLC